MVKRNFWDWLAYAALAYIFIWLILKVTGVINTPLWLTYSPLFGAAYVLGWQVHELKNVSTDVKDLKKFKNETLKEIQSVKLNCVKNHG